MHNQNISDEHLNSFVDDQLDSAEKNQIYDAISQDKELQQKVCGLRGLKEVIQHAYSPPPAVARPSASSPRTVLSRQPRSWATNYLALAACLLLLLGGVSGWVTNVWASRESNREITSMIQAAQRSDAIAEARKVIIHVNNSSPMKIMTALDETEGLLDNYRRANRQIQVEVIANKQGVDLLRSNVSAHEKRISLMQEKYPNLSFMVCGKTISKLRNNGESVALLPHTGIATSAADQINKRLNQGWGYIRI